MSSVEESAANFMMALSGLYVEQSRLGTLQLAMHVVQNRQAGTQESHWGKTNHKGIHNFKS